MEQKFLKRKPRKVAPGRAVSMRPPQEKVVLVGTYKGKQLVLAHRHVPRLQQPQTQSHFIRLLQLQL